MIIDNPIVSGSYLGSGSFIQIGNSRFTGSVDVTGSLSLNGNQVFTQGGNSFGAQAVIGTNDNQNLGVETNGSIKLFISASGAVGINTTTPGALLDVVGSGQYSGAVTLRRSGTSESNFTVPRPSFTLDFNGNYWNSSTGNVEIYAGSVYGIPNGSNVSSAPSTRVVIKAGSTDVANFSSTGNVGIGTVPNLWQSAKAIDISNVSIAGIETNDLHLSSNAFYNGSTWIYISSNRATNYYQSQGIHGWRYAASGSNGTSISWSEAMRIDSSGNVGIGTTNPTSKLFVNGASYLDGYNYASSIQFVRANSNTVNPAGGNGILIFSGGTSQIRVDTSNIINFDVNNSGSPHTALAIRQNGNTVIVNSPDNNLCLGLSNQSTTYGYMGSDSGNGGRLLAYSVNGGFVYLSSASTWVNASDRNIKKNFEPYTKGLDAICKLEPQRYNLKIQEDTEEKLTGLVAQQVGEHIEEAYSEGEGVNGMGRIAALDYNVLTVTLINAVKELKNEIDQLKLQLNGNRV